LLFAAPSLVFHIIIFLCSGGRRKRRYGLKRGRRERQSGKGNWRDLWSMTMGCNPTLLRRRMQQPYQTAAF
jgi:hypothetical protein